MWHGAVLTIESRGRAPDALPSNIHMLLCLQCLHKASCMNHAAGFLEQVYALGRCYRHRKVSFILKLNPKNLQVQTFHFLAEVKMSVALRSLFCYSHQLVFRSCKV